MKLTAGHELHGLYELEERLAFPFVKFVKFVAKSCFSEYAMLHGCGPSSPVLHFGFAPVAESGWAARHC